MVINPNKLFRWLSIRSKLVIAFVGLSLLPLLVVGSYAVITKVRMMEDIALENLTHDVHSIREKTSSFLSTVESDLRVLRGSRLIRDFLSRVEQSSRHIRSQTSKQLVAELLAFVRSKRVYYQIRLIASDGTELLRVEQKNPLDSHPSFSAVPVERLRTSREAYSFYLVEKLGDGQIAFAPAELLTPHSDLLPVFTFVTPLAQEGTEQRGLLIANVFAKDLFQAVESNRHLGINGTIAIVSSDGHYLYHSEKKSDWNRLLASREEDILQKDYPRSITDAIFSGEEGTVSEGADEIISYAPLFESPSVFPNFYFVFESVPKDVIFGSVYSSTLLLAGILFVFLAVSAALALLATRQFTKPVAELQRGAEIVARGDYGHRLRVETHDEIETLAGHFNIMAEALEKHEQEIHRHRVKLEELVEHRTKELYEEKGKLQAILDNVPSAFVLLDHEFRIQSASAAFESVTGLRPEDVKGKDCEAVFCRKGFCSSCISRDAVLTERIQSHVDHVVSRKEPERYLEHIAIPMKEQGRLTSILEIITDVTRRQKFEENAIRTERLMAVGEMSAFIAHEIRNALTSTKMILQLHRESAASRSSDRKSLEVALDSVYHLEGVVTGLLNFARPRPFVFRQATLNAVVSESIAFVRPHLSSKRIALQQKLDPSLPTMTLDVAHLREAVVNLLLNAVQALDGRGGISVATSTKTLRKTLREYVIGPISGDGNMQSVAEQKELILSKGARVALVEIADTGRGMDRRNLRQIFEPFFSTKSSGSGLGLPMAKRIVNAHGGIISVWTRKGGGSKFTVVIPLVKHDVGFQHQSGAELST
ncbi:MAG: ATP-binding protein [Bacteroidota bacterium]